MYNDLKDVPRLLLEADLEPVQGTRFQPTGFPDLGAAEYSVGDDGKSHLLVESAQSVANRLENAIWDEPSHDLVAPLAGMPYVKADVEGLGSTNSILESHRLNSPYLLPGIEEHIIKELDWNRKIRPDLPALAKYLLKHDPNSLIHGIFFSNIKPGTLRLPRLLSGFIEAEEVSQATSGGVKFDRLDASGSAKDGKGHVPFHRVEYTAKSITAYFNLDLHRMRSYGLGDNAENFLISLSLYKIRRFLDFDLRLRTACDLDVKDIRGVRPKGFVLQTRDDLAENVKVTIAALTKSGQFAQPPVREVSVK
jgi:CRISPR-associated protein Csb1